MAITAGIKKDDLLRFRIDGGMWNPEFAMAFSLNVFLQRTLVRRMVN
jgi:hypothetical protein